MLVQLDFSAVFDSVSHDGILLKLHSIELGGPVPPETGQFLRGRSHRGFCK